MKTLSYVMGNEEEIKVGGEYYFGQLWDGDGDGQELLESGAIALDEDFIVSFDVTETDSELLKTLVKVTDIY